MFDSEATGDSPYPTMLVDSQEGSEEGNSR